MGILRDRSGFGLAGAVGDVDECLRLSATDVAGSVYSEVVLQEL